MLILTILFVLFKKIGGISFVFFELTKKIFERLGYLSGDFSVDEYSKTLIKRIENPMDETFFRNEVQKSNVDVVTYNLIRIFNQVMK